MNYGHCVRCGAALAEADDIRPARWVALVCPKCGMRSATII